MHLIETNLTFKQIGILNRLRSTRTPEGIFRLPLNQSFCHYALTEAYVNCVNDASIHYIHRPEHENALAMISGWLVGYSYKCGLWLCGLGGTGKTTIVKAIQKLILSLDIQDPIKSNPSHQVSAGLVVISATQLCNVYVNDPKKFQRYQREALLAIDDLGAEPEKIMNYGQQCNPFAELLAFRYENRQISIVTTNLPSDVIRNRYGDRAADRVKHMMEVVTMPDTNYRNYSQNLARF